MVPAGYTAVAPIKRILALLEQQGFDTSGIRNYLGLSGDENNEPEIVLAERAFDAILDAVSVAGWRYPGVTIGRIIASELTCMHLKLASSVSNIAEWLALIPPTEALIGDLGSLHIEVTDTATEFFWTMAQPDHPAAGLIAEAMLVATARNIDDVSVAYYPPIGAELLVKQASDKSVTGKLHNRCSVLENELRCAVTYSSSGTILRYGPDLLARATHQITGQLPYDGIVVQSGVGDEMFQDTVIIDISQAILAQLEANGACIDSVASQLALSTRTLQRRLGERGLSYSTLVMALRQSRSKYLLLNSELSIDQIAAQLGYDRANAFGAAFRRWWGESPARYRRLHGKSPQSVR